MGRDIRYQVSLHDAYGVHQGDFVDILNLDYARADKQVGSMTIYFPYRYVDAVKLLLPPLHNPQSFGKHAQLRLWRTVDGVTSLEPGAAWIILKPARVTTLRGERFIKIQAYDWLWVLTTRMVAFPAGEPQAEKVMLPAEQVLTEWFTENFDGTAERNLVASGQLLLEAGGPTGGPTISGQSAWEPVFTAMVETCEVSEQKGRWLSFDFVSPPYPATQTLGVDLSQTGDFPWALRYRYDYLGKDRRPGSTELASDESSVILSTLTGNLYDVAFFANYADEFTGVYGLGKGTGPAREVIYVDDALRQAGTPFGRVETIEQARDAEDPTAVEDAANTKLEMSNPWRQIVAGYEDTHNTFYGRDFFYQDAIAVEDHGVRIPVRVNGVQVTLADGKETKKLAFERMFEGDQ